MDVHPRFLRFGVPLALAWAVLAGPARAGFFRGYPNIEAPFGWVLLIAVAGCKSAYLWKRYNIHVFWTSILMSASTLIWCALMSCFQQMWIDIGELPVMLKVLLAGYGLAVGFDWAFACPAMPRSGNVMVRSLKAAVMMDTVLGVIAAGVLLWVHTNLPPFLEDRGPD